MLRDLGVSPVEHVGDLVRHRLDVGPLPRPHFVGVRTEEAPDRASPAAHVAGVEIRAQVAAELPENRLAPLRVAGRVRASRLGPIQRAFEEAHVAVPCGLLRLALRGRALLDLDAPRPERLGIGVVEERPDATPLRLVLGRLPRHAAVLAGAEGRRNQLALAPLALLGLAVLGLEVEHVRELALVLLLLRDVLFPGLVRVALVILHTLQRLAAGFGVERIEQLALVDVAVLAAPAVLDEQILLAQRDLVGLLQAAVAPEEPRGGADVQAHGLELARQLAAELHAALALEQVLERLLHGAAVPLLLRLLDLDDAFRREPRVSDDDDLGLNLALFVLGSDTDIQAVAYSHASMVLNGRPRIWMPLNQEARIPYQC